SEPAGYGDAGPLLNTYFLTARRLVEAGVRCVSLAYGRWDWHGQPHGTNFENARDHLPFFDQGVSALVEDLHQRGLDKDVSVVVWGEFGRTPRINPNGGRDHWPQVSCALLAGGGLRTGQVIGSTNRLGEHAKDRPVHFQEIFATLYHCLGIDVHAATVPDRSGRRHAAAVGRVRQDRAPLGPTLGRGPGDLDRSRGRGAGRGDFAGRPARGLGGRRPHDPPVGHADQGAAEDAHGAFARRAGPRL